ncbi:MAG: Sua5/YciO/YrdC/YwlC family protein, partial [Bacteroidales bacterium]|nr:Sua5/YciO/YrdC/YwlC family protein [Bacteroidales bacterium]
AVGLAANVVAEDGTIAIRVPSVNEFCTQLLRAFRKPIVSTSANISGEKSPVHLKDVSEAIASAADWTAQPSWDAGATGKASSIIKLGLNSEVKIIRE